jgi:hypothetical protein
LLTQLKAMVWPEAGTVEPTKVWSEG